MRRRVRGPDSSKQPNKKKKMSKKNMKKYLERKKWQQLWINRHGGSKWY